MPPDPIDPLRILHDHFGFSSFRDGQERLVGAALAGRDALGVSLTSSELEELRGLRRENKRLRIEREILKKAAVWFAQETDSVPPRRSSS